MFPQDGSRAVSAPHLRRICAVFAPRPPPDNDSPGLLIFDEPLMNFFRTRF
jgi:hypothetical protein